MEVLSTSTLSLIKQEKVRAALRQLLERSTESVQVELEAEHPRPVLLSKAST